MAALRWSSDFIVGEYRDVQANTITLDCTGRYLLLPSRRQLAIKDLTEPIDDILLFPRAGKGDVVNASWNPHLFNKELCALCAGTSIEILSWYNESEFKNVKVLRSHTRAVTGVDWHPVDPNTLSSSSLDNFTYIWDIRDPQKPVISFSSFAGASHVKWNKLSRHLLATTHGGDIKIWDERKNTSPVQYITAYLSNVFCIDWSPGKQNHISAANQDGKIKIYDIREPQKTHALIEAGAPVWKVSYTPFGGGNAIVGVMVPEMRRSESSLLLWHLSKTNVPLHTFVGHTEIVLDIEWRTCKQDDSEFQLITWDKDNNLRIWEVDKHLLQLCGQDRIALDASNTPIILSDLTATALSPAVSPIKESKKNDNKSTIERTGDSRSMPISNAIPIQNERNAVKGEHSHRRQATITTAIVSSTDNNDHLTIQSIDLTPTNLSQEFAMSYNIPNMQFDKVDPVRRLCSVTIKQDTNTIVLLMNFPPSYPRKRAPIFRLIDGTTINNAMKVKLLKVLKDTAEQKVRNNEVCLEACLTQLVTSMEQMSTDNEESSAVVEKPIAEPNSAFSDSDKDEPYFLLPRSCGAKFCHIGTLVCFMKPKPMIIDKSGIGGLTLKRYLQSPNSVALSARTRYVISQGLLRKIKISARIHTRLVVIYDVSSIFLVNKKLAEKYVFTGRNMTSICKKNAQVAATVGRKDLVDIWNLAALSASPPSSDMTEYAVDWDTHPFARDMIESIINYYSSAHDIQTAAMLACVFSQRKWHNETEFKSRKMITAALPSNFAYHTVHPTDTSEKLSNYTRHRSNSWSECSDDIKFSNTIERGEIIDVNQTSSNLERAVKYSEYYETLKILYGELLNRWQLLIPRTLVMKCISSTADVHRGVEFVIECAQCKNSVTNKVCPQCKMPSLVCVICRLSVKGSANFCLSCGHGGHTMHMQNWFKTETMCPSGCKCECLLETNLFFSY